MNKAIFYFILLFTICSCKGNEGDLMKLVAERDSLKAMAEKQELDLKTNNAVVQAIVIYKFLT